jgi:GNAT superfamily N-acetyltransferase
MSSAWKMVAQDGSAIADSIDDMVRLYADVYSEPPYNSGSLWKRDAFISRTERQSKRPGFSMVLARTEEDEKLVGYAFGLPFDRGQWWSGDASKPPPEILAASKFALIELIVDVRWRNRGIGHRLHDRILRDRTEAYAMLTALPEAPARNHYEQWGWRQIGVAQHTPDSPQLHSLILSLNPRGYGASGHCIY